MPFLPALACPSPSHQSLAPLTLENISWSLRTKFISLSRVPQALSIYAENVLCLSYSTFTPLTILKIPTHSLELDVGVTPSRKTSWIPTSPSQLGPGPPSSELLPTVPCAYPLPPHSAELVYFLLCLPQLTELPGRGSVSVRTEMVCR